MTRRLLLLVLVSGFLAPTLIAQDSNYWGDVTPAMLESTTHELDADAKAVVLAEWGEVKVEANAKFEYHYRARVKLLSDAAFEDWGTISVPYRGGARRPIC